MHFISVFTRKIYKWIDEGSPVDTISLDFKKIFDNVPHQRLNDKVKMQRPEKESIQLDIITVDRQ